MKRNRFQESARVTFAFLLLAVLNVPSLVFAQNESNSRRSLYFVENNGQWKPDILFQAQEKGLTTWITESGIYLELSKVKRFSAPVKNNFNYDVYRYFGADSVKIDRHIVKMKFKNSKIDRGGKDAPNDSDNLNRKMSRESRIYGVHKAGAPVIYAKGMPGEFENEVIEANRYQEVHISDVYKGVSVRFYFDAGHVRYDIYVDPHGQADKIQIEYDGASSVEVDSEGDLLIHTSLGHITQSGLAAYQNTSARTRRTVDANFKVQGNNTVTFKLGKYSKKKRLIIDPLISSSYIGGSSVDIATEVLIDDEFNSVIVGATSSSLFDSGQGGIGSSSGQYVANDDIYVAKISQDGENILQMLYIGGVYNDRPLAAVFDPNDQSLLITGYTGGQMNLPNSGVEHGSYSGGNSDAFILRVNSDLNAPLSLMYLGGDGDEYAYGIDVNAQTHEPVVCGFASASSVPFTTNTVKSSTNNSVLQLGHAGGGQDAFLAIVSSSATSQVASVFLGGTNDDRALDLIAEPTLNYSFIMTGLTYSTNFHVSAGPQYDASYGGNGDAFLSHLVYTQAGDMMLSQSTYLGSTNSDVAYGMAYDVTSNAVCVVGATLSSDFPVTRTVSTVSAVSSTRAFVCLYGASSFIRSESTLINGSGGEEAIDVIYYVTSGQVAVCGITKSTDFPLVDDEFGSAHLNYSGKYDSWFVQLSHNLGKITRAAYIGGSEHDIANSIASDVYGRISVVGTTESSDFPARCVDCDKDLN